MTTYIVTLPTGDTVEVKADNVGVTESGTLFFEIGGKKVAAFAHEKWNRVLPKP